MLIIELNTEKYGKAMKNILCIELKLAELKTLFELEVTTDDMRTKSSNVREFEM